MNQLNARAALAAALLAGVWHALGCGAAVARGTTRPAEPDRIESSIAGAALRFGLPADWIRAVIRAESGGDPLALSRAGAMGLMQLMPSTYADLRSRYGLGADPYQVQDNILAGSAYLRELHDRYGPLGMLAAYNAGPGRWEEHVRTGRALPPETARYLAKLGSAIGIPALELASSPGSAAAARQDADTLFVRRGDSPAAVPHPAGSRLIAAEPAPPPRSEHGSSVFVAVAPSQIPRQSHAPGSTEILAEPARAKSGPGPDRVHDVPSLFLPGSLFIPRGPGRPAS